MDNSRLYGRLETYLDDGVIVELFNEKGESDTFRIKNAGNYAIIAAKALLNGKELTLKNDPMLEWLTMYKPTLTKVSEAV